MEQNLSLYYVFHTVAKKGSISHAAKELYISQPAISKSIQKLEDESEHNPVQTKFPGCYSYRRWGDPFPAYQRCF